MAPPTAPRSRLDGSTLTRKVFSALRHLGFRESAAKAVQRELRADAELSAASVDQLLREALRRIRPTAH